MTERETNPSRCQWCYCLLPGFDARCGLPAGHEGMHRDETLLIGWDDRSSGHVRLDPGPADPPP
jgi:hypothetical protein